MAELVTFLKTWGSMIIAGASLLVAIVSLIKASKTQKLQNKLNQMELSIKHFELEKMEKETRERSCVEARIIHIAERKWKLKVWNSGNTTAYNVVASIEGSALVIIMGEKMPFEELEPNKSFEVNLIVTLESQEKFRVITTWEDEKKEIHEKEQMVSL